MSREQQIIQPFLKKGLNQKIPFPRKGKLKSINYLY